MIRRFRTLPRRQRWLLSLGVGVLCLGALAVSRPGHLLSLRIYSLWRLDHPSRGAMAPLHPPSPVAAKILAGARAQIGTLYNASYRTISYPMGDVDAKSGACTDVVIRALRAAGYDLQKLIHDDMKRNWTAYPHRWGLQSPDPNIDHRRVPNQQVFFQRYGKTLPLSVAGASLRTWQPGDIVEWKMGNMLHTGVVSDTRNARGEPFVIHNNSVCVEDDALTRWPIIGHFRYPAGKDSR